MNIELRNATPEDSDRIASFVSSLALTHIGPSLGKGGIEVLLASMDMQQTRKRIEDGWLHIGAFSGNDLVGIVVIRPPCHLYHLFVHSSFQRMGIGAKLFAAAEASTTAAAQGHISTVNASLNAVDAYVRLGFTNHGPVVDTDGVRYQPMVRHTGWNQ